MAKVEAAYIQINASSSYTLVRSNITYSDIKSSATYSNLSAAEVILDYDTKNRYFRDEEFTFEDLAALTPEKSFTDSVGAVSDVLQSVGVGKSAVETFGIGDFSEGGLFPCALSRGEFGSWFGEVSFQVGDLLCHRGEVLLCLLVNN